MNPKTSIAEYLPIQAKMAILKKKKMFHLSQEDEALMEKNKKLTPHFMIAGARAVTSKEASKNAKSIKEAANIKVELD